MPELPEVETVRRGLERLVVGKTIQAVDVRVPKMVKTDSETFALDLMGLTVEAVRRRGADGRAEGVVERDGDAANAGLASVLHAVLQEVLPHEVADAGLRREVAGIDGLVRLACGKRDGR